MRNCEHLVEGQKEILVPRDEEEEIDNFQYEFNEIVVNQLGDLDPQYGIDIETIKEILLLEQKGNLTRGFTKLLRSKRKMHSQAYKIYREALHLDGEGGSF